MNSKYGIEFLLAAFLFGTLGAAETAAPGPMNGTSNEGASKLAQPGLPPDNPVGNPPSLNGTYPATGNVVPGNATGNVAPSNATGNVIPNSGLRAPGPSPGPTMIP